MNDEFVGKNVTLSYRETRVVELSGEIVSDTPEGVTIRHTYRKGKRLEFIPRDKLQSLFLDEEKRSRKPSPSKVVKPKQEVGRFVVETSPKTLIEKEPVVEEEDTGVDETLSEVEDFDDGDEEFDDDDDEFE